MFPYRRFMKVTSVFIYHCDNEQWGTHYTSFVPACIIQRFCKICENFLQAASNLSDIDHSYKYICHMYFLSPQLRKKIYLFIYKIKLIIFKVKFIRLFYLKACAIIKLFNLV